MVGDLLWTTCCISGMTSKAAFCNINFAYIQNDIKQKDYKNQLIEMHNASVSLIINSSILLLYLHACVLSP